MKRKLASVQSVSALIPIEGADNIELAKIEGWQCVVKKGEFQVGDVGAYFEIDSIPPDTPQLQFLWAPKPKTDDEGNVVVPEWDGLRPDKFRIRTMKLRGALSQGLLMPLSDVVSDWQSRQSDAATFPPELLTHGADLTEFLGVLKYEPPQYDGIGRAPFPGYVPRTDEMRVQSCPEVLEETRGLPYIITEKVDGQSGTFLIDRRDDTLHCCSRNHSVGDGPDSRYFGIARKYGLEELLRRHPTYAIQGELYGPAIQGNKLKTREVRLTVFNIYDFGETRGYLDDASTRAFCAENGLEMVRIVDKGESFNYSLEELLALAEGKYDSGQEREGIVIRPQTERQSAALQGRLSFKAISNRFLLKNPDA